MGLFSRKKTSDKVDYDKLNGLDAYEVFLDGASSFIEIYNEYIHLDLKCKLQNENSGFRIDLVMCGIASLIYITFIFIFIIYSYLFF